MSAAVSISELLARDARVVDVARLRWAEWGHEPGSTRLSNWVAITKRECSSAPGSGTHVPVTLVAVDRKGCTAGAVGLVGRDPEGLPDRGPWVVGTVVRPDLRGLGVGLALMTHLEHVTIGLGNLWVSTQEAAAFYTKCGYASVGSTETILYLGRSEFTR